MGHPLKGCITLNKYQGHFIGVDFKDYADIEHERRALSGVTGGAATVTFDGVTK